MAAEPEETRGRDALCCLVCGGAVKRLDQSVVVHQTGIGWSRRIAHVITRCEACGTQRLRMRELIELDEGDFEKRSLR